MGSDDEDEDGEKGQDEIEPHGMDVRRRGITCQEIPAEGVCSDLYQRTDLVAQVL